MIRLSKTKLLRLQYKKWVDANRESLVDQL